MFLYVRFVSGNLIMISLLLFINNIKLFRCSLNKRKALPPVISIAWRKFIASKRRWQFVICCCFELIKVRKQLAPGQEIISPPENANQWDNGTMGPSSVNDNGSRISGKVTYGRHAFLCPSLGDTKRGKDKPLPVSMNLWKFGKMSCIAFVKYIS